MSSSVIKRVTLSQMIQLCWQKVATGTYLYQADFLPTQLDQLTPSGPFLFFLLDFAILYYSSSMVHT
jgi:hypothetical protein